MSRHLLLVAAVTAWTSAPCAAQGAGTGVRQHDRTYRVDRWTTDDGLPSHSILDITQSRNGYLWLATSGGLVRFDGVRFEVYSTSVAPQAATVRTRAVYAGIGDTVWVTFERNGVFSFADGRFTRWLADSRLVDRMTQDTDGRLVVGSRTLWRVRRAGTDSSGADSVVRDAFATIEPTPESFAPTPQVWRDTAGTVWLITNEGRALSRLTERGVEYVARTDAPLVVTSRSRQEVFTVRARGAFAEVLDLAGVVRATYRRGAHTFPRLIDGRGVLWVTTPTGIEGYAPGSLEPIARFAIDPPVSAIAVVEDREGNIWLGTSMRGLWRVQPTAFGVVAREHGFKQEQVLALWQGDSTGVLAADASQSVFRVTAGRAQPVEVRGRGGLANAGGGIPDGGAYVDARGTLWVAKGRRSARGALIGRRPGHSDLVIDDRIRTPQEISGDPVRPDWLWFHDGAQAYRAEPYGESGPVVTERWGLNGSAHDMLVTKSGVVWLAGFGRDGRSLLWRIRNDSLQRFTSADGLPPDELRGLAEDDSGTLWIGTYGAGIYRLQNGTFAGVTTHNGLAEDVVSSILLDDTGNVWMAGNRGVHRAAIASLNDFLNGRSRRVLAAAYGRRDGLRNPETSGGSAVRAVDGLMWFPTFDGAAFTHPLSALALDSAPPLVRVEAVFANGDSVALSEAHRLPRARRRLEFAYTGISLRNPDALRFEYRLDGYDAEWVDAGASRRALYARVGPGRYTFRVRAVNGGAVPSTTDATMAVSVPAYFVESTPFFVLLGLAVVSLAYAAYGYRVRHLTARGVALRRMVDERTAALVDSQQRTEESLRTVAAQATQLRALDQARSRFVANVSHEFRTPLSLILGPLEDIREGRAGPIAEPLERTLDTVLRNGRRLVRLVDQLLDVARLEAGALQLRVEVHDLVPYLRRTAESFASMAERQNITFVVSCPVGGIPVRFDPDQMDKVLSNLLGNALKFTPGGGRVELRAATEAATSDDGHGWVVISVGDTGPGIAPEHVARVFERFYQVDDSARRAHEGAGIGLALVRELVHLHGGQVGLQSTPGAGSTFTVRLPLVAGDARPADANGARETSVTRGDDDVTTVLLVEDNAELLAYLREHLATRYRVLEAANGSDALTLAREHVPDLIVSDIMMPVMDGHALCHAVKSDAATDFVPVILLTAKASRESKLAGLEGGADDYLTKPVDLRELFVRAENLIKSRRRLRERFREEQRTLPTLSVPLEPARFDTDSASFVRKLYEAFAVNVAEEDLEVDALASALAVSRRTLYRRIETLLGRSPMDLLWEYRLEQAAQWLRETDASVSEVAYGVGFKSVPHFCTRFRDRFGATPSAFRADRVR